MKNVCDSIWSGGLRKTTSLALAGALLCLPLFSQDDDEEEEVYELSPFTVEASSSAGYRATSSMAGTRMRTNIGDVGSALSIATAEFISELGATVGGAQNIALVRAIVAKGLIPPSDTFTPEGLFSEHDLPIGGEAASGWLFDIAAQATTFESAAQPNVDVLAQLGFISGIDAATFKPQALNLIAVVDKSGSMSGRPLKLVRKSLIQIASQLGSNDQLSIVLYGHETDVYLQPTKVNKENLDAILQSISQIYSSGSTYMEAGLKLGYEVAKRTEDDFKGLTRVMLFTDEQPNVGRTDADSFMTLARDASEEGVGLTTIGVGVHFGAELAEKISSVRGGNLFFFDEDETMEDTFRKELDTMVLELAYDMELTISPMRGIEITGLYGIPGDAVNWNQDGSLSLEISTIFASHNKGGIYFGLSSIEDGLTLEPDKAPLATARIVYTQADNMKIRQSEIEIALTPADEQMEGIVKGAYLVDQYASLKLATRLYESGEYQAAAQVAKNFAQVEVPMKDKALDKERDLVSKLADQLVQDCEIRGLTPYVSAKSKLNRNKSLKGEWIELRNGLPNEEREILRFTEDNEVELYSSSEADPLHFIDESDCKINNHYIVFEDWGRTFRYKVKGDQLVLKTGDRSTAYARKTSLAAIEETTLIRRLQQEISGLPQDASSSMLSIN